MHKEPPERFVMSVLSKFAFPDPVVGIDSKSISEHEPRGVRSHSGPNSYPTQDIARSDAPLPDPNFSSLFLVLTVRLLNLAAHEETKEFRDFHRFSCLSVATAKFRNEIHVERSYAYLRKFFSTLGGCTQVFQKEIALYLSKVLTGIFNCAMAFSKLHKLPVPLLGDTMALLWSGEAISSIKFQTCWFWNYHLRARPQDYPPNDGRFGLDLFGWKRDIMRRRKETFFQYSLFMGLKKGLPPLDPSLLLGNLEKHQKSLTRVPSLSDERSDRISRYVDDVVQTTKPRFKSPYCSSSLGAGFEKGRAAGGQRAAMLEILRERYPTRYLLGGHVFQGFQISCRDFRLEVFNDFGEAQGGSFTCIEGLYDVWFDEEDIWGDFYPMMKEEAELYREGVSFARTTPHGILEPMKVRIITKGDVFSGNMLAPVKDCLQSCLTSRCFSPVFRPSDEMDVFEIEEPQGILRGSRVYLNRKGLPLELTDSYVEDSLRDQWWCSGDFSNATDDANMLISEQICDEVLVASRCPQTFHSLALRSLCSNVISFSESALGLKSIFPDLKDHLEGSKFKTSYRQTNGQLMGSIISFPILCLMNLFSYWEARERFIGQEIDLETLLDLFPVLIHGDDILFRCSSEFYHFWSQVTKEYGFNLSLGKNLFLPNACTIDSIYFTFDGPLPRLPQRRSYLNMGLVVGCRKGDQTEGQVDRTYGNPGEWNFWERCAALESEFQKTHLYAESWELFLDFCAPHLFGEKTWYIPDMYKGILYDVDTQVDSWFNDKNHCLRFMKVLPSFTVPTGRWEGAFLHGGLREKPDGEGGLSPVDRRTLREWVNNQFTDLRKWVVTLPMKRFPCPMF